MDIILHLKVSFCQEIRPGSPFSCSVIVAMFLTDAAPERLKVFIHLLHVTLHLCPHSLILCYYRIHNI
ncbi:hypothetical protein BRADI_2g49193v3 [Brachypodium distachyon]|uniref:Uncharacterized protein n=1 Tax=Brachypodium distachyon TaxID=15368 RepID=A0A0Q3GEE1_BRADI|nr:hypothetical protein BRADI_2g49193v3 [Brachypodium distachyon]